MSAQIRMSPRESEWKCAVQQNWTSVGRSFQKGNCVTSLYQSMPPPPHTHTHTLFLALHLFVLRNSVCLTWVRLQQSQKQRYPFLTARELFELFLSVQTKVRLSMLATFTMRTGFNECDCTRGLYRRRRRVCTDS